MIVRNFDILQDRIDLERIHRQYKDEFSLDEFRTNNYLGTFSILNDENKLITAGGVRTLIEAVLVTDKELSVRERRQALVHALQASGYIAKQAGYDYLHAFIQDEVWLQQLLKHGFKITAGKSIITRV